MNNKVIINKVESFENEYDGLGLEITGMFEGRDVKVIVPRISNYIEFVRTEKKEEIYRDMFVPTEVRCNLNIKLFTDKDGLFYKIKDVKRDKLWKELYEYKMQSFLSEEDYKHILNTYKDDNELEKLVELFKVIFR